MINAAISKNQKPCHEQKEYEPNSLPIDANVALQKSEEARRELQKEIEDERAHKEKLTQKKQQRKARKAKALKIKEISSQASTVLKYMDKYSLLKEKGGLVLLMS